LSLFLGCVFRGFSLLVVVLCCNDDGDLISTGCCFLRSIDLRQNNARRLIVNEAEYSSLYGSIWRAILVFSIAEAFDREKKNHHRGGAGDSVAAFFICLKPQPQAWIDNCNYKPRPLRWRRLRRRPCRLLGLPHPPRAAVVVPVEERV
jgi:hypothetical protein